MKLSGIKYYNNFVIEIVQALADSTELDLSPGSHDEEVVSDLLKNMDVNFKDNKVTFLASKTVKDLNDMVGMGNESILLDALNDAAGQLSYLFESIKKMPTLEELNERRIERVKRSHGKDHPSIHADVDAVMRNKVVEFIGSHDKGRVTFEELLEYFNKMNEDEEIGKSPSRSWIYKNTHLIERKDIRGKKCYELTRAGKNMYEKLKGDINESVELIWVEHNGEYITNNGKDKFVIYKGGSNFILQINGVNKIKGSLAVCKGAASDFIKTNEALYNPKVDKEKYIITLSTFADLKEVEKLLNDKKIGYWKRQGEDKLKFDQYKAFKDALALLKIDESKEDKVAEFIIELEKSGYDIKDSNGSNITFNKQVKDVDDLLGTASMLGINANYDAKTNTLEISKVNECNIFEKEFSVDDIITEADELSDENIIAKYNAAKEANPELDKSELMKQVAAEIGIGQTEIYDTLNRNSINESIFYDVELLGTYNDDDALAYIDTVPDWNKVGTVKDKPKSVKYIGTESGVDVWYDNMKDRYIYSIAESKMNEASELNGDKQGGISDKVWNHPIIKKYNDMYGWLNNNIRTDELDKKLEKILTDAKFSDAEKAAFMISSYGRHMNQNFDAIDKAIKDLRKHFSEHGTEMFESNDTIVTKVKNDDKLKNEFERISKIKGRDDQSLEIELLNKDMGLSADDIDTLKNNFASIYKAINESKVSESADIKDILTDYIKTKLGIDSGIDDANKIVVNRKLSSVEQLTLADCVHDLGMSSIIEIIDTNTFITLMESNELNDGMNNIIIKDGKDKWWVTKIDSTHVEMVNDPKYIGTGGMSVHHVGEFKKNWYYNDLVKWLHGEDVPAELVNEAAVDHPEMFAKQMIINAVVNNNPDFDKNLAMKRLKQDLEDTKRNIDSYKKRQGIATDKAGFDSVISKYERWKKELEYEIGSGGKWIDKLLKDVKNKDYSEIDKWDDKGNLTLGTFREDKINEQIKDFNEPVVIDGMDFILVGKMDDKGNLQAGSQIKSKDNNSIHAARNGVENLRQEYIKIYQKLFGSIDEALYIPTDKANREFPGYEDYPNIDKSGSLAGMKKLYGWDSKYIVQIGNYYYNLKGHPNMKSANEDLGLGEPGSPEHYEEWFDGKGLPNTYSDDKNLEKYKDTFKLSDEIMVDLKKMITKWKMNESYSPKEIATAIKDKLPKKPKEEDVVDALSDSGMKFDNKMFDNIMSELVNMGIDFDINESSQKIRFTENDIKRITNDGKYYYAGGGDNWEMRRNNDDKVVGKWNSKKEELVVLDDAEFKKYLNLNSFKVDEAGEMDIIQPDHLNSYPKDMRSAIKFWKSYGSFDSLYSAWNSYAPQNPYHKNKNFLKELNVAVEKKDVKAIMAVIATEAAFGVVDDDPKYVERTLKNMDIGVYESHKSKIYEDKWNEAVSVLKKEFAELNVVAYPDGIVIKNHDGSEPDKNLAMKFAKRAAEIVGDNTISILKDKTDTDEPGELMIASSSIVPKAVRNNFSIVSITEASKEPVYDLVKKYDGKKVKIGYSGQGGDFEGDWIAHMIENEKDAAQSAIKFKNAGKYGNVFICRSDNNAYNLFGYFVHKPRYESEKPAFVNFHLIGYMGDVDMSNKKKYYGTQETDSIVEDNVNEDYSASIKKEFPKLSDAFIKKVEQEFKTGEKSGILDRISTLIAKELGQIGDDDQLNDEAGYKDTISKTFKIHNANESVDDWNETPKYKVGDMVYSWQNKDYAARVSHVFPSTEKGYPHKYKLALTKDGYSQSSKWTDEQSLFITQQKTYEDIDKDPESSASVVNKLKTMFNNMGANATPMRENPTTIKIAGDKDNTEWADRAKLLLDILGWQPKGDINNGILLAVSESKDDVFTVHIPAKVADNFKKQLEAAMITAEMDDSSELSSGKVFKIKYYDHHDLEIIEGLINDLDIDVVYESKIVYSKYYERCFEMSDIKKAFPLYLKYATSHNIDESVMSVDEVDMKTIDEVMYYAELQGMTISPDKNISKAASIHESFKNESADIQSVGRFLNITYSSKKPVKGDYFDIVVKNASEIISSKAGDDKQQRVNEVVNYFLKKDVRNKFIK